MAGPYANLGNNRVDYIWLILDTPIAPSRATDTPGEAQDYIIEGLTKYKNMQNAVVFGGVFDLLYFIPEDAINNHLENLSLEARLIKTIIPGTNTPGSGDTQMDGTFIVNGANPDASFNGAEVDPPGDQVADDNTPSGTVDLDFSAGANPTRPWNFPAMILAPGESLALRIVTTFDSAEVDFDPNTMNYNASVVFNGSIGP